MGCKKFNRKNQNSGNQKFNIYNKHNDEFVDIDDEEFDMINITDSDYEEDMFEYDDIMDDVKINETKFIDNKPKKVLHTIDSVDYDRVTDESVKILESDKKKNDEEVDLLNVNPDVKKRKSQMDVDKEIVEKFYANPTEERFKMIWDRFYYGVHSHACNIMGDWERAEDMVQETFQRAWAKRMSYNPEKSNYSTWIYTICRNICATNLRRERNDRCVDVDVSDVFDNMIYGENADRGINDEIYYTIDSNGKVTDNSYDDITKQLYDASISEISKTDPLFQKIIFMKDVDEIPMREIAEQLGVNESKVKNTYYKWRGILGDMMKEKYSDLYEIYREASHDRDESDNSITPYKTKSDYEFDDEELYYNFG